MSDIIKQNPRELVHLTSTDHVPALVLLTANKGFLPMYLPRYLLIGNAGYGSWVTERNVQPWLQCVRNPGEFFEMGLAGIVIGVVPTYELSDDDDFPNLHQKYKYQVIIDGVLELVDELFIQNAYIEASILSGIPFQRDYGVSLAEWAKGKTESSKLWFGK